MRLSSVLVTALCVVHPSFAPGGEKPLREAQRLDDFTVSEQMVPMRDGVRLYTLILTPKAQAGPLPILLERTPYDATRALSGRPSTRLQVSRGPQYVGGGYIFVVQDIRGRYRQDLDEPRPLSAGEPLAYTIPLPHLNHSFRPGHRLMIQVQSTWFPLYDRNPQTFVPSIMSAEDEDYQAQRHRVHHGRRHATHIEMLVDTVER